MLRKMSYTEHREHNLFLRVWPMHDRVSRMISFIRPVGYRRARVKLQLWKRKAIAVFGNSLLTISLSYAFFDVIIEVNQCLYLSLELIKLRPKRTGKFYEGS